MIHAGVSGLDIDEFVYEDTKKKGGLCAPLNYRGYPAACCVSVNECICHGIPGKKQLQDGDIVNVDITTIIDGWHGDTSATFYIGHRSDDAKLVVETARDSLTAGISEVRPGARLGDVGAAIQMLAASRGLSTVTAFVGHGIGRGFHESPNVPHFGKAGRGLRLMPGLVFTIEPMINVGSPDVEVMSDGWTALTLDRKLSAQFEHTVCLGYDGKCEVLTARSEVLQNSET
jgi:methionyl aminopeptidase